MEDKAYRAVLAILEARAREEAKSLAYATPPALVAAATDLQTALGLFIAETIARAKAADERAALAAEANRQIFGDRYEKTKPGEFDLSAISERMTQ